VSQPDAYVQRWLGPLIDHDAEYGGELVRTLSTYLRSADDMTVTARELGIHRSTARYRLYNIHRRFGLDLHDPVSRLGLMRATALWLRRDDS
jgi:DNA-binding PucR family transcriptional regulator